METFRITIDEGRGATEYEMTLPDLDAARAEVTRIFGDMIRNGIDEFWSAREWRVSVSRAGMPLFVLRASALELGARVGEYQ